MNEKLVEIKTLEQQITSHHYIVSEVNNRHMDLPIFISNSDFLDECPDDLKTLLNKLDELLCGYFISSDGQCSRLYYEAKKQGFKLRVGEKDSFGPLSCCYTSEDYNWTYCYG